MQISTRATKAHKSNKLSWKEQQSANQVDQRGKTWQRTNKRQQWENLEA